jgi:pimeloyl-[acyl-carrier protein] methyl ester esterase
MKHLLMLHGWGFPSAVFDLLHDKLAPDFVIEMPDRPGYGDRSDHPSNDLSKNYAHVRLTSPTLVLGWSLGGLDALQLALRQPDMVTGLILLATTPCFVNRMDWQSGMDKAIFDAFRKQVMDDPAAAMQQFVRLNAAAKPNRQTRERLAGLSVKVSPSALLEGLYELENTDLRDSIEQIEMPVLLLHASDDRVIPVSASHWLQQRLPDSRLHEFPAGGHAFFLQHTSEVADQVRDFSE